MAPERREAQSRAAGKGVTTQKRVPVGIELGAQYSRIAAIVKGGVKIITGGMGEGRVLSSFYPKSTTEFAIGQNHLNVKPGNYITDACQPFYSLSTTGDKYAWNCRRDPQTGLYQTTHGDYSQQRVVTAILKHLRTMAMMDCADDSVVEEAVIAIPSYSTNPYRRIVLESAKNAGFSSVVLINQSTAAAMAFKLENPLTHSQHLGVVLAGARSFEASVFAIDPAGGFRLVSTSGSAALGGNDVTAEMVQYTMEQAQKKYGPEIVEMREFRKETWINCELAKEGLAGLNKAEIMVACFDKCIKLSASREKLAELKTSLLLIRHLRAAFNRNYAKKIDQLLVVGGSSQLQFVVAEVGQLASEAVLAINVPKNDAVVSGAAIAAALKFSSERCSSELRNAYVPDCLYQGVYVQVGLAEKLCVIQAGEQIPTGLVRLPTLIPSRNGSSSAITVTYELGEALITSLPLKSQYGLYIAVRDSGMVELREVKLTGDLAPPSRKIQRIDLPTVASQLVDPASSSAIQPSTKQAHTLSQPSPVITRLRSSTSRVDQQQQSALTRQAAALSGASNPRKPMCVDKDKEEQSPARFTQPRSMPKHKSARPTEPSTPSSSSLKRSARAERPQQRTYSSKEDHPVIELDDDEGDSVMECDEETAFPFTAVGEGRGGAKAATIPLPSTTQSFDFEATSSIYSQISNAWVAMADNFENGNSCLQVNPIPGVIPQLEQTHPSHPATAHNHDHRLQQPSQKGKKTVSSRVNPSPPEATIESRRASGDSTSSNDSSLNRSKSQRAMEEPHYSTVPPIDSVFNSSANSCEQPVTETRQARRKSVPRKVRAEFEDDGYEEEEEDDDDDDDFLSLDKSPPSSPQGSSPPGNEVGEASRPREQRKRVANESSATMPRSTSRQGSAPLSRNSMRTARVIAMENQVTAKALKDWLGKSRSELEKAIIKLKSLGRMGSHSLESMLNSMVVNALHEVDGRESKIDKDEASRIWRTYVQKTFHELDKRRENYSDFLDNSTLMEILCQNPFESG